MANTSYLRYVVEPWVRSQLEIRFEQRFSSQKLPLSPGGNHEFDAVSDDKNVVVAIKTSTGLTGGNKRPAGKFAACLNDVYFLTLIDAPIRILILTNPSFYELFVTVTAGKIPPEIWVEPLILEPEMQLAVDAVTQSASNELTFNPPNIASPSLSNDTEAEDLATHESTVGERWIYENDVHKYARIHKGDCPFCNFGLGVHNAPKSGVGRWISLSETIDVKNVSRYPPELCRYCSSNL